MNGILQHHHESQTLSHRIRIVEDYDLKFYAQELSGGEWKTIDADRRREIENSDALAAFLLLERYDKQLKNKK